MNDTLQALLTSKEGEHLEFKEARTGYDFDKLTHYLAAFANEGGGKFVLGVSDRQPRKVVGTSAFRELDDINHKLLQILHLRVDVQVIQENQARVLVFTVPSRPVGTPIAVDNIYWMRSGSSLVSMTPERLKAIFDEATPDFSAQICPKALISDLEEKAVQEFCNRWARKSQNQSLMTLHPQQCLEDAELIVDGGITYAALILMGGYRALGRYLAQAEVVFEYRSRDDAIEYQQRKEYRQGFFLFHDDIWQIINSRNERTSYRDGLFRVEIQSFNEDAIREALLNAICHRDYRRAGSVFVRQWLSKIEISSPGGFPEGITQENILWKQNPRNRRIAEAFARCGMVERSGQGADLMFRSCLQEGKDRPDYGKTDEHDVSLSLSGKVRDPQFVKYMEELTGKKGILFNIEDLVVLDAIHNERDIPERCKDRLHNLLDLGAIEKVRRRYILASRFYKMIGKKGIYTRKKGLERSKQIELLLKHIVECADDGSTADDFQQIFPELDRNAIASLLRELRSKGKVRMEGKTKGARWYPVADGGDGQHHLEN